MGFNALSNSEYAYNVEQVEELTDDKYALGDSISLACTSTKLLRSVNGLKNVDITPKTNAGANLLATITGVAVSPNNTALVVGTNPAGVTTAPVLFSPNGINFSKSANTLAINARCVTYYNYLHSFLVGCTSTAAAAFSNAVLVCTQQGVVTSGLVNTLFPNIGDMCNAISTSDKGSAAAAASVTGLTGVILYGGQFGGGNVAFGFDTDRVAAGTVFVGGANLPAGAGSINAISNDNGILDNSFVYTLAGGSYTAGGGASNLVYNFRAVGTNPAANNAWVAPTSFDTIFPLGVANSSVNAIAFNGQYFLVGGLGTVGVNTNTCTVAIATFTIAAAADPAAQGTIDLAIPTGCNIANLMTNVRSLAWNGLYWIAGGDNTGGFVYARSTDAVTWTLIGGAIEGATSGLSVSSRFTPQ
jgi:hypothetical protein